MKLRAAGVLATLAACTVGPDYEPPQPDMPAAFRQSISDRRVGAETDPAAVVATRWWGEFGDPQLADLVRRAVAGSPPLAVAFLRIRQSRAILQQVGAQFVPDIDGQGGYSRSLESRAATPFPTPELDRWSLGLDVVWEIDLFGRIRRSVESAGASAEAAVEDYFDVLRVLQADVAFAYVDLRTLQRRLAFLEENIATQRGSRDLAQARFETEIAPELDVAQAESNLANTESQKPALHLAIARTRHRLAVLLGEHAGALDAELGGSKPLPAMPEAIELGIPAELLRRRPDVRRSERDLAAQCARIGAAEALLYPQFSLAGAFGTAAMDLDQLFTGRSRTWSVVPGMRLNIFDGGRVLGAVREEEALFEAARVAYHNTVLLAVEEVENAIAGLRYQREQRAQLERVVTATRRSSELAESLYREGLRSFQNVLDAQRTLATAQDALAQSEGAEIRAVIELYRALGGGWRMRQIASAEGNAAETDENERQ